MCDDSQRLPPWNSVHDSQATWLVIEHALLSHGLLLVEGLCKLCKFQELPGTCEFFLLPESYEHIPPALNKSIQRKSLYNCPHFLFYLVFLMLLRKKL